jgi:hypothetical protein
MTLYVHWRFCGHAVKAVPLKIRVRTNQKSELMAAWNEDAIHITSEFRLPAMTRDIIRLEKQVHDPFDQWQSRCIF